MAVTMTVELENRLRKSQRQMLRMILNSPRRTTAAPTSEDNEAESADCNEIEVLEVTLEPWVEWIRRNTHDADSRMHALKLDNWITIVRKNGNWNFETGLQEQSCGTQIPSLEAKPIATKDVKKDIV